MKPRTILLDARNLASELPRLITEVNKANIIGLDCETQDSARHAGITRFCKYDEDGFKSERSKLVFDMNRTIVTGFSVYIDGSDEAWYINLNHADVENRVSWDIARYIIQAKQSNAYWICHNAPFELTVFSKSLGCELTNVICTLQLAVSTYGPDEYTWQDFVRAGLGDMKRLIPELIENSRGYDPQVNREFSPALAETVNKITAKESRSAHSYNGFVKSISYGYGLKDAVKSHFGYEMATFDETLDDNAHMGQLTGEQVRDYGAEDAYWAVKLFHHLIAMASRQSTKLLPTFFSQENPMIYVFSDIWQNGMVVNRDAIVSRRAMERAEFAALLRRLKAVLRDVGDFASDPDPRLMKREKWYPNGYAKYRKQIREFAASKDCENDFDQCMQVRSAVSNAWAEERGINASSAINLTHYMPMRVLIYDLLKLPLIVSQGKVQSDGDARGTLKNRAERVEGSDDDENSVKGWKLKAPLAVKLLEILTAMGGVEQRMKLYLTPYLMLTDPETGRMYPNVTSQLASRRMAASFPNPMQLAKRGESTYIRGFYLGDTPEHLVVSLDWSAIELVIVGELSGDAEFRKAFGQLPHDDLHAGAAADILSVDVEGLTEKAFKNLKKFQNAHEFAEAHSITEKGFARLFTNLKGEPLNPSSAYKYWRTEVGKGANFNYWFSGWLATVGDRMGWSADKTKEATDRYRARFPEAEAWRVGVIEHAKMYGWVELPDGHRRTRLEATDQWLEAFIGKWPNAGPEFNAVVREFSRRIQRRAFNQAVNSMVQGTCATIAKRSSLRIREACRKRWNDQLVRFLIPIHDELVFSVHRSIVAEFVECAHSIMIDHRDIFPTLMLDASPSVGITFEPYHAEKAPFGQVELFEPPAEIVGEKRANTRLDADGIRDVVQYLTGRTPNAALQTRVHAL